MTEIDVDKAIDLKEYGLDVEGIQDIRKFNKHIPALKKMKLDIKRRISKRMVQLVQKSKLEERIRKYSRMKNF